MSAPEVYQTENERWSAYVGLPVTIHQDGSRPFTVADFVRASAFLSVSHETIIDALLSSNGHLGPDTAVWWQT
jgi:hypothetical protein